MEGIWVGKFEISSSTPTANYGGGTSTIFTVRTKPNVNSWRYNPVDNFSKVIQNMQVSNNEYGIYDMSGGASEYVMGNMSGTSGSYTYNKQNAGSNFTNSNATAKYIDTYAYGTSTNDQIPYNRARLGDATGEVKLTSSEASGWYNDSSKFISSIVYWLNRGGNYITGTNAGAFHHVISHGGQSNINYGARSVLVSLN